MGGGRKTKRRELDSRVPTLLELPEVESLPSSGRVGEGPEPEAGTRLERRPSNKKGFVMTVQCVDEALSSVLDTVSSRRDEMSIRDRVFE